MNALEMDALLARYGQARIAVAGDFFLDRYLHIDPALTTRSIETGLDVYEVVKVRPQPGAGGTVTNNLVAQGVGHLFAVSAIGVDGEGFELKSALQAQGISVEYLIERKDRATPTYTKPLVFEGGKPRELNRLDIRNRTRTPRDLEDAFIGALNAVAERVDGIIVADQVDEPNLGLITERVRAALAELADRKPDLTILADSRSHIGHFRRVMTKPNQYEAVRSVGAPDDRARDREALEPCGREMARRNGRPVFITRGPDGILLVDPKGGAVAVPGYRVTGEIDIVGAGDSTSAGIVSALCAGARPMDAALVGCLVASITIQQIGTTGVATPEQVKRRFADYEAQQKA